MLNDVYPPYKLPDFRLGADPRPPRHRFVTRPLADSDSEEHAIDADIPSSSEPPLALMQPPAPKPSAISEQPSASTPPSAPVQPSTLDVVQQLIADVH